LKQACTETVIIIIATEFSAGGSSPYTGTDKTKKNKMYIKETIKTQ
jgi:hypothetical protein